MSCGHSHNISQYLTADSMVDYFGMINVAKKYEKTKRAVDAPIEFIL